MTSLEVIEFLEFSKKQIIAKSLQVSKLCY